AEIFQDTVRQVLVGIILIDEHTRYPIVEVISALDAQTVTKKLRHIFAMFGLPKRLKSDNGPPFSSNNFIVFLDEFNIEHHGITPYWPEANGLAERSVRTIKKAILCANIENKTPYWPEANGLAERSVRTIKKAILCANIENKNLKEELDNFLLNYRSTQHSTTGQSPFSAIFNRNVRNTLPTIIPYDNSELRKTDRINKEKQISQANKKRNIKEHNLQIGDIVICKQNQTDKLTPAFNPLPYKITLIKGTKVTAERENSVITRNASFFKPYISRSNNYSDPNPDFHPIRHKLYDLKIIF
ncbi:Integrase core domain, partial [Popillia japonica]